MKHAEIDAIELDGFTIELLETIERVSCCDNPIIYGGSLRDRFFESATGQKAPINDWDVLICLEDEEGEFADLDKDELNSMLWKVKRDIEKSKEFKKAVVKFSRHGERITMGIRYKGMDVDINIVTRRVQPENVATLNDAPINGIASDLYNQKVVADKRFEDAIGNLSFKINNMPKYHTQLSVMRFLRLKSRLHYSRLELRHPSGLILPGSWGFNFTLDQALERKITPGRDKVARLIRAIR